MDFYYAMTNYHVLCCLIHRMCLNKSNKGVLYISSYLQYNQPNIVEKIKESGIFEDVRFYNELEYTRTKKTMNSSMLNKEIKRLCNEVEKQIGKVIKKTKNFYLCSDFYSIGLYLITNKIKYNYFEDGCGTISKPSMPFRIIEKDNPNRAAIVKKVKALGENEYVIKRYACLNSQEKGYYNKKDTDFSVRELLKELPEKDINKILKIYETKKINIKDKKATLLLTMHYNELMSENEQRNVYALLLDYFLNDKERLVIKPHPSDTIKDYESIFKNSKVINRYMPSELFPYCLNNKFEKGITCYSTAIYNLKNILNKIVTFTPEFDDTYKDMDKYYAIVNFLNETKNNEKQKIKLLNINEVQLMMLFNEYFSRFKDYYEFVDEEFDILMTKKGADDIIEKNKSKKIISLESLDIPTSNIFITKEYKNYTKYEFVSIYNYPEIEFKKTKKQRYQKYEMTYELINENQINYSLQYISKNQNEIIEDLSKDNDELHKKNDIKEQIIENLNITNKNQQERIKQLSNEIEALKTSTSWKITKIFRIITDKFRGVNKRK